MTTNDILSVFSTIKNGRFFRITFSSNLNDKLSASAKKSGYTVEKITNAVVRKGLIYDNIKSVQEDRKNGILPATNGGLRWGTWKVDKLIIENKGVDYVRLYKSKKNKANVQYLINGVVSTLDDLKAMGIMQPSYFTNKSNNSVCFDVKADGVISIG